MMKGKTQMSSLDRAVNVLSLFDGCSMGRLALERAAIPVKQYFASEIDKYAITIAKKNFPNTIHLGDVTTVRGEDLEPIDLLIGGSPCQGFSFASKGRLNFDDPKSKLFFEYVRILKEFKPKYFLFENVRMKQECQDIISEYLGVKPIAINSRLVSAQNRVRLYWTNIPVDMPEDKGIVLKDIIEKENPSFKYYKLKEYYNDKIYNKDGCHQVGEADIKGYDIIKRVYGIYGKAPALTTMQGGHREPKIACSDKIHWRKLTPLECERLQTLPDGYTDKGVSNSQRYKMLGNGFTVDVIAHILKSILIVNDEIIIDDDPTEIPEQTTMTNLVIEEQEKEEDDSIIEDYHNWGMHH